MKELDQYSSAFIAERLSIFNKMYFSNYETALYTDWFTSDFVEKAAIKCNFMFYYILTG